MVLKRVLYTHALFKIDVSYKDWYGPAGKEEPDVCARIYFRNTGVTIQNAQKHNHSTCFQLPIPILTKRSTCSLFWTFEAQVAVFSNNLASDSV